MSDTHNIGNLYYKLVNEYTFAQSQEEEQICLSPDEAFEYVLADNGETEYDTIGIIERNGRYYICDIEDVEIQDDPSGVGEIECYRVLAASSEKFAAENEIEEVLEMGILSGSIDEESVMSDSDYLYDITPEGHEERDEEWFRLIRGELDPRVR